MIALAVVRGCAFLFLTAGLVTAIPAFLRRGGVPCWQSFGCITLAGLLVAVNAVMSDSPAGVILGILLACMGLRMTPKRRREQREDARNGGGA